MRRGGARARARRLPRRADPRARRSRREPSLRRGPRPKTAHAHPAIRAIGEEERAAAERLARDFVAALAPLRQRWRSAAPLRDWLAAHRAALDAVAGRARGRRARRRMGSRRCANFSTNGARRRATAFPARSTEYAALFDDALAGVRAPPAPGGHPRLKILGLLEARLLRFDRVLLAGLDEKVWPPAVETDAFLNRPMRAELGLSAPERRIGQTAHDFVAALGAPEAILSRAKKRGGEPTVASRFLQRIGAAAGAEAIAAAERRGKTYLGYARALDRPEAVAPVEAAGAAAAGRAASALAQRHPDRDPAARPLRDLRRAHPEASAARPGRARARRARGGRRLARRAAGFRRSSILPARCRRRRARRLVRFARARFAALLDDPAFEGVNWPNIEKAIDFVIDFERRNRGAIERILVERRGEIVIPLGDGEPFKLTARADRIDAPAHRRRDADRLQERDAAGRQGGEDRPRAAADAGGRDPDARRLRRAWKP